MPECEAKPSFKMNSLGSTNQTKPKANENIQVYVRVRPLNSRERSIGSCEVVDVVTPKEVVVRQLFDSKTPKKFTFDRSFGPESRQSEVYHSVVAPLIEEVLAGYNCTVFAYGQTGTGKTHTMIGTENPELKSSWEDESMVGIIPRALSHLFDELRMMKLEFSMRISYLELYNEELCDLLSSGDSTKIRIFDDSTKKGSIIVSGLEEIPVHSKDDVYKLLEKGKKRRKTATTIMNAQSSRSHTVFSILVHIRENSMDGEEMLKIGKLNLVDLAGCENISKAGNDKGIRTRETFNKNQSLLTLGRVMTALVERTPHIPYRESKLTRLLQESLGGRTKTSLIATISPGDKDLQETLSTLEYAHRAKNIQNRPEINQKLTKKTVRKEEGKKKSEQLMKMENIFHDLKSSLENYCAEILEIVNQINTAATCGCEKLVERITSYTSNFLKEMHEIEEEDVSRRKQVDEITQRMQTLGGRDPIKVESKVRSIQTISEAAQKYFEILEDIVSQEETETHAIAKRCSDETEVTTVSDYSSQNNCTMSDCKKSLRTIKEEEIKPYTPTEQTPSRKDFSYPRILAATSPHANIIRRYKMEKEWSDADTTATITEDSESRLHDVSSDELGINSTPIRSDIESDDSKLKDIQSEFNRHISKIHNLEHKAL